MSHERKIRVTENKGSTDKLLQLEKETICSEMQIGQTTTVGNVINTTYQYTLKRPQPSKNMWPF